MPPTKLDRRSAVPLYFQLQEVLKGEIELGAWKPGEDLPSETELCNRYQVSRTVVRQALAILEQDRQIQRSQGRRTSVLPPKLESRAGGVTRLLARPRLDARLIVLSAGQEQAAERVRDQLQVPRKTRVLRTVSLLELNGGPVALFDSSIAMKLAKPFWAVLPKKLPAAVPDGFVLEVELGGSQVSIETSFCSTWEADRLHIAHHGAVFVTSTVETRVAGSRQRPFEVARGVYRADRVQFRLEFNGDEPQAEAQWQLRST
jgi:GntR family transcriptional regulator, N-acetylglucosamine utilization regulator